MAWRNVLIQNPARLTLENGQLRVEQDSGIGTLPLEDITTIILESPQITVTSSLLSAFQDNNIVAIICDSRHSPNGILLPFHQHSRISEVTHLQKDWALPLRKRFWQLLVKQKITNQAMCLKGFEIEGYERLLSLSEKVTSGDADNIEAQAAKYYWKKLFGADFIRGKEDTINSGLNYGYAVIRSVVSRSIVSYGLIPTFGIHHDSNLNAFNLADDLIEVFRPFVDAHIKKMTFSENRFLTIEERQHIADIANLRCLIGNETHTLINASDMLASDLVVAIRSKTPALSLPSFNLGT